MYSKGKQKVSMAATGCLPLYSEPIFSWQEWKYQHYVVEIPWE